MDFRIRGLDPAPFAPLFHADPVTLARSRAVLTVADSRPGFPCRVSLDDAEPGEPVLLVNYQHLPVDSPYRASHAIYVSRSATPFEGMNVIPGALRSRLLSIRAFDGAGLMVDADIVEGREAAALIERLLGRGDAEYLHVHFARRGCFAARVDRA